MESIGERICAILEAQHVSKTALAKMLHISQSYISMVCAGVRSPSDRTIADICRIFSVSEEWLRTGEGRMQKPLTRNQEIVEFLGALMNDPEDAPRKRFIAAVAQLTDEECRVLLEIAKKMAQE